MPTATPSRPAADPRQLLEPGRFLTERALALRQTSIDVSGERHAIEIVGQSPPMEALLVRLDKIRRYSEPVLVTGESGVGKEWFARAVQLLSPRRARPLVTVNCPQFQEGNLTVSELFGHTRGSFTGAVADRRGAFEEAQGGVLFLDEVGDLHPLAQAMLLRAIATGEYKPLGADRARTADVRVVAATNRDLNQLVLVNQFRYDLLCRLWYFHLAVPPLRERGDDWRLLLDFYLNRLAAHHGVEKRFSPAAVKVLENYRWPGNVRQLIGIVTMGYAMADGDVIEASDFASEMEKYGRPGDDMDSLYDRVLGGASFWDAVYEPFMNRDLNRSQIKAFIRRGLGNADNNYRRLLDLLQLPASDYQRFMDFLRHHDLKP
jgi:transcriptional regulator with GAF, ATPase, and Fis domain